MEYLIEYTTVKKNGKSYNYYFERIGILFPAPNFGSKEKAMRFKSKAEARKKLKEFGASENEKFKIIKA